MLSNPWPVSSGGNAASALIHPRCGWCSCIHAVEPADGDPARVGVLRVILNALPDPARLGKLLGVGRGFPTGGIIPARSMCNAFDQTSMFSVSTFASKSIFPLAASPE